MKHTKEMYVHVYPAFTDHHRHQLFSFDNTRFEKNCVLVGKQTIEFEVPDDFNPVPAQIQKLEEYKAELHRQFNEKIAEIKEQISKLQAITFEATA